MFFGLFDDVIKEKGPENKKSYKSINTEFVQLPSIQIPSKSHEKKNSKGDLIRKEVWQNIITQNKGKTFSKFSPQIERPAFQTAYPLFF